MFADLKLDFKFWFVVVFDLCVLSMFCVAITRFEIKNDLLIFVSGFMILLIWYLAEVYLIDLVRKVSSFMFKNKKSNI